MIWDIIVFANTFERDRVDEACALWTAWTGNVCCRVMRRRLAYRIGLGRAPNEAALAEFRYSIGLYFGRTTGSRSFAIGL